MRPASIKAVAVLAVLDALCGCAATPATLSQDLATVGTDISAVVAGAQVACKDAATGQAVVATVDPSIVAHNQTTVDRVTAACKTVNALPQ